MDVMDCRAVRPLISAYMDSDLTPAELRAMQAHVATCPDCAALLDGYRQTRSLLRALPQPLPPARLRPAVFAAATPAYRRRAFFIMLGQRGLTAGAIAVVLIAALFTASLFLRTATNSNVPPQLVAVDPPPGVSVSPGQPVRLTFNKPMDELSVKNAIVIDADPPLSQQERVQLVQTEQWDDKTNTLTIGGGYGFQPDHDYTIRIDPAKAHDRANTPLEVAPAIAFSTSNVVPANPSPTALAAGPPFTPTPVATPTGTVAPTATEPAAIAAVSPTPPATSPLPVTTPAPTVTATPKPANPPTNPPPASQEPPAPARTATPTPQPPAPTATPEPPAPTATAVLPTATTAPPTATAAPPTPTAAPQLPYPVVGSFGTLYQASPKVRDGLGLPSGTVATAPGAYLAFERGAMFWRGDTKTIYVLFYEQPGVWYAFADNWTDGMDPGGGAGPAAGQFYPKRGFGKVWRENEDVRNRLGYALAADETAGPLTIQPFDHGLLLARDAGYVYVLYSNGVFERYQDPGN
ncbi:MAG: zf-HC2 domain-containing protein [Thermomicrobiales bacterium]